MTQADGGDRPLTLLHVFSTFAVGGPQTRFATIVDRLGGKYRHLIVSMSGRTEAASLLTAPVSYELVPAQGNSHNPAVNVFRFTAQLRRIKPDLLVTYNWGALEWAIANRFGPRFDHVHIEDGFGPDEAIHRFKRRIWLRRIGLRHTRAVVVPSHTLEQIATKEWKLRPEQLVYLPNGVELDRFGAFLPAAERAFAKKPGELVIGTCAALRPEKNLGRLIRAFAASGESAAKLVICGDGSERPHLQSVANAHGVSHRVLFTGYLAQPEKALANFDIFAMSSDTEQMPYGLLEAMAAGLPAAATDVGDTSSIVAESNLPFIVPVADEAALTGALRTLIRDAPLRARVGADNRAKAERDFSLDTMIAAYDRLFSAARR